MELSFEQRVARLSALGDPIRLAMVDELARSDRAPAELKRRFGLESNLLAHHLDVLEDAGLIVRSKSSGDGRRRYVHLLPDAFEGLAPSLWAGAASVLFVCTANSARSQLAAALWRELSGGHADSAGTHPAPQVHRGAVAAAKRAGLDLGSARPKSLDEVSVPELVVTVCDKAHEEVAEPDWLHWSIGDPVPLGNAEAFDAVVAELRQRMASVLGGRRQDAA